MDIKQEMQGVSRALRMVWEDDRLQYTSLIRRASWTNGPIYVTGNGASYLAGITGAYAFESLLDLPVVVRPPATFNAFTSAAVVPRSLLIAISDSGECEATLEAAEQAKKRGATVWALTRNVSGPLALLADGIVPLQAGETPAEGIQSTFLQHATMVILALAAAHALKKPSFPVESIANEFERLPQQIEWLQTQMADAARTLAAELKTLPALLVAGGGFHHPAALQACHHLGHLTDIRAHGFDLSGQQHFLAEVLKGSDSLLVLSGSRSRLKTYVHQAAREARRQNMKVFAITDPNDRQLSERATLAVLLPVLTEPASSLLNLALLSLIIHYVARKSSGQKSTALTSPKQLPAR